MFEGEFCEVLAPVPEAPQPFPWRSHQSYIFGLENSAKFHTFQALIQISYDAEIQRVRSNFAGEYEEKKIPKFTEQYKITPRKV